MFLFILCALFFHCIESSLTLLDKASEEVLVIPTLDFFEYDAPHYHVKGLPVQMRLQRNPDTNECEAIPLPKFKESEIKAEGSVMYVKFADARNCGLQTISQV